jgi:hypothetical protein
MVMSAGVLGEDTGSIGHGDAARIGGGNVDVVDAVAEIGDQLEVRPRLTDHRSIDAVGDGRHQHIGGGDRLDELGLRHRGVFDVQPGVEQLAHARLDLVGQLARHNHERLLAGHCTPRRRSRSR